MSSIQFKIVLEGITPPITRTFQVDAVESFFDLHEIIQIVMGWENVHLFEFHVDQRRIGLLLDDEPAWTNDEGLEDSELVTIDEFHFQPGATFRYVYDFGDDWNHKITVSQLVSEPTPTPICLSGQRSCPPEDCGGAPGYLSFLEAYRNPKHPNHAEVIDWIEDFDPEEFDLEEVNQILVEYNEWRKDLVDGEE